MPDAIRLGARPWAIVLVCAAFLELSACARLGASDQGTSIRETWSGGAALDHVSLHVADEAASVRFYTEALGLREIPAAYPHRRWFALDHGAALHIGGGRTSPIPDDDEVHFALACDDLDVVMARLKAHGVTWYGSDDKPGGVSTTRGDGIRQIYFRDPDGYWIEVNDAGKRR